MSHTDASGGGFFDALGKIDSFVRTLLATVVVGGVGFASWLGYNAYYGRELAQEALEAKTRELAEKEHTIQRQATEISTLNLDNQRLASDNVRLTDDNARLDKQNKELLAKIRLLKVDHRIAEFSVLHQEQDDAGNVTKSRVMFVEQDKDGQSLGQPQEIPIEGDTIYIDYWVAKFDDSYVEEADLLRGTSICLLRRIFSSKTMPENGIVLDRVNSQPRAYGQSAEITEFEQRIWREFWDLANSPQRAKELGIREAHGEAVSIKLVPGKRYRVLLRASGGPSIKTEDLPSPLLGQPST